MFCFPSISKNEAFGLALAEGMYYEKPAVTFTIPGSGVNYVSLNRVTGIEVENRNVEKYADAMRHSLRIKNCALNMVRQAKSELKTIFCQHSSV